MMADYGVADDFTTAPRIVDVTELMEAPEGMIQVGDEFCVVDEKAAPDEETNVVGVCELCGREIRDTTNDWSRAVGHVCEDGYREHRHGKGICEVDG